MGTTGANNTYCLQKRIEKFPADATQIPLLFPLCHFYVKFNNLFITFFFKSHFLKKTIDVIPILKTCLHSRESYCSQNSLTRRIKALGHVNK